MTKTLSLKDTVFAMIPDVITMRKMSKMRIIAFTAFAIFFLILGITLFMWESECRGNQGSCLDVDFDSMHKAGLALITISCVMFWMSAMGKLSLAR